MTTKRRTGRDSSPVDHEEIVLLERRKARENADRTAAVMWAEKWSEVEQDLETLHLSYNPASGVRTGIEFDTEDEDARAELVSRIDTLKRHEKHFVEYRARDKLDENDKDRLRVIFNAHCHGALNKQDSLLHWERKQMAAHGSDGSDDADAESPAAATPLGAMSFLAFSAAMAGMGCSYNKPELQRLYAIADTDKSASIGLDEFLELYARKEEELHDFTEIRRHFAALADNILVDSLGREVKAPALVKADQKTDDPEKKQPQPYFYLQAVELRQIITTQADILYDEEADELIRECGPESTITLRIDPHLCRGYYFDKASGITAHAISAHEYVEDSEDSEDEKVEEDDCGSTTCEHGVHLMRQDEYGKVIVECKCHSHRCGCRESRCAFEFIDIWCNGRIFEQQYKTCLTNDTIH